MPFIGRVRSLRPKPSVIYFHDDGYEKAFGRGRDGIKNGMAYADYVAGMRPDVIDPADFIFGALWGNDHGKPVAQFHGYRANPDWHVNPTFLDAWVFIGGEFVENPESRGCGEMTMAFGIEERHRRYDCRDVREFIIRSPRLPVYLWNPGRGYRASIVKI